MSLNDALNWIKERFPYPVPEDYLSFLKDGDFVSTLRMYYVTDDGTCMEISEWFNYDDIADIYKNCRDENMIEDYHLPVFDSCGCTAVLNCNKKSDLFGKVFLRTPDGYYDEDLKENIYEELMPAAESFSEILENLKTSDELEEAGIL